MINADDIKLEETCGACPEQYDAYYNGEYVGYLRLRHGRFTVDDKDGNLIYAANPKGDGIFDSDERQEYLEYAKQAIAETIDKE
jgi:hypothetical protein